MSPAVSPPAAGPSTAAVPQRLALSAATQVPQDLSRYKEEPVPGGVLLVVAYAVMWLLVAGFVARLLMRQAKLEVEVAELEDRLDKASGGGQ